MNFKTMVLFQSKIPSCPKSKYLHEPGELKTSDRPMFFEDPRSILAQARFYENRMSIGSKTIHTLNLTKPVENGHTRWFPITCDEDHNSDSTCRSPETTETALLTRKTTETAQIWWCRTRRSRLCERRGETRELKTSCLQPRMTPLTKAPYLCESSRLIHKKYRSINAEIHGLFLFFGEIFRYRRSRQ